MSSLTAHDAEVHALAVSTNGLIATGGFDHSVKIWDLATQDLKAIVGTLPNRLATLALSANGHTLAAGDGEIARVWVAPFEAARVHKPA